VGPVSGPDGSCVTGCEYRVFSFRGRPVVSLAATGLGRRLAFQRFQPTTPRRSAFRAGVALASALGADRWLARAQASALPVDMDSAVARWVTKTLSGLGAAEDGIVVVWPPQPDRGRLYVHASDARGRPVAFVKVALDERNNHLLAREVAALGRLARERPSSFDVPEILAAQTVAGSLVVVGEPLPAGARSPAARRAVLPAAAVTEYAGPVREATDVTATSWWQSYRRSLVPELAVFDDELTRAAARGTRTARAHGDLSAHNMALVGGRLWLLDWEESAPDAPVLTDLLGFVLSAVSRRLVARPEDWRTHLRRSPAPGLEGAARQELMLALAFRHARGFEDATGILRHWNRSAGWGVE